ncbi:MAG: VOC family protein [Saprospirales bacterium]|nr:VOC family protein [Saprospirales bacterium]MBK8489713.1 VOC family protein [Saprospirales bacterium]
MKTPLQSAVSWFEIPVTNLVRAKKFYETILDVSFQDLDLGPNHKMALFPAEPDGIGGALALQKDFYFPGNQGPVVYLNANPDLQSVLNRIEGAGGKITMPKRQISEENGFMAIFEDSEGNRIALHSIS